MTALLSPGTVVGGDYQVVRELAQGGMGAVYVAEQLSTAKLRALKVMRSGAGPLEQTAELRARFVQEARVGARIASPHVVEVVGAGVDGAGFPFLAMELLEGADLSARVQSTGPQPPAVVAEIFLQLTHAVAAAHDAGIVHRDLKPENVFLARAQHVGAPFTVKVLDFGIAKLLQEVGKGTSGALGSPLWMAPEQTEAAEITPATDVWALGLLAFHALTGVTFWRTAEGGTIQQLLREILLDPIPPGSLRAREKFRDGLLPPGFDELFARSVARQPAERLADARAFGSQLAAILGRPWQRYDGGLALLPPLSPLSPSSDPAAFAPTALGSLAPVLPATARSAAPPALSSTDATSVAQTKRSAEHPSRPPPGERTPAPRRSNLSPVVAFVLGGGAVAGATAVALRSARPSRAVAEASVELPSTPSPVVTAPTGEPIASPVATAPALSASVGSALGPAAASASATGAAGSPAKAKPMPIKEGFLPKDVIESRLRGRIPSMNACIKDETAVNPSFQGGRITTNFWIGTSGSVTSAGGQSTDLPPAVVQCVLGQLRTMRFPAPEGGPVNVIFPIRFNTK